MDVGTATRIATLIWDARFSLVTALLAGFGRAAAEVGAIIIVGGTQRHECCAECRSVDAVGHERFSVIGHEAIDDGAAIGFDRHQRIRHGAGTDHFDRAVVHTRSGGRMYACKAQCGGNAERDKVLFQHGSPFELADREPVRDGGGIREMRRCDAGVRSTKSVLSADCVEFFYETHVDLGDVADT